MAEESFTGRRRGHHTEMDDSSPARRFMDALKELESSGDTGPICDLFAGEPTLLRPEVDKSGSSGSDPARFWEDYKAQFSAISTEFTEVQEGAELVTLEWSSSGQLSTGRDIDYRGVSILSFDDEGRVRRFATYYDTAAFLEPADHSS